MPEQWVPWDLQVINASPSVILWKKKSATITVRVPGLYLLSVAIFTVDAAQVQVYLNDELLFSLSPAPASLSSDVSVAQPIPVTSTSMVQSGRPSATGQDRYSVLQRYRHSLGEVSSLQLQEFVSLPPEARLAVRYLANQGAQGFFALRKL